MKLVSMCYFALISHLLETAKGIELSSKSMEMQMQSPPAPLASLHGPPGPMIDVHVALFGVTDEAVTISTFLYKYGRLQMMGIFVSFFLTALNANF